MDYSICEMKVEDFDEIHAFWNSCGGIRIDDSDSRKNFETYLTRNSKLCHVAIADDRIIGTIKCGHDGRRGYLHHCAVHMAYRKRGIAKALIRICLDELKRQGIDRCNTFVLDGNNSAIEFWKYNGWDIIPYDFRTLQVNLIDYQ